MNTTSISFSDILQLSVSERIQLVEDIWDSIQEVPDELGLTDSQRKELARRAEDYYKNPHEGIPWNTLKEQLLEMEEEKDNKAWNNVTAEQFLSGYSELDAIYE